MTFRDPLAQEIGRVLINGIPYIRPIVRVAVITVDGASCTVPVGDLMDMIEGGGEYTVEIKTMSRRKFEQMPEFTGW